MSQRVITVQKEVCAVDRHSLYGTSHKFTEFYDSMYLARGLVVPFNVQCDECDLLCAIDMVQQPGYTKFWCTGEFDTKSPSNPGATKRCGFSVTYPNEVRRSL